MTHEHTPESIEERLSDGPKVGYLRDWIYGGIDGAITTFAIVSGVVGGKLSPIVIIVLGVSNLIADGFSMAAGNYLGTQSEHEEYQRLKAIEERHIQEHPEGEKAEIRQILANKGIKGQQLSEMVEHICSNEELWISMMLHEEYGLPKTIRSSLYAAMNTFLSFLVCGFVPLIPYVFSLPNSFQWSITLTGFVFFAIGSIKSKWTLRKWYLSGLVTLSIGTAAASIAYFIGYAFHLAAN